MSYWTKTVYNLGPCSEEIILSTHTFSLLDNKMQSKRNSMSKFTENCFIQQLKVQMYLVIIVQYMQCNLEWTFVSTNVS